MNAYGIGVRAGAFTPTPDDEDYFRDRANLPKLSAEARDSWSQENNVRRPITLVKPGDPQKDAEAAALAQAGALENSLEKLKAEIKNERAQPISTEKIIRIQQPITKPKAVNFKRDESGRICGATLEEVEA